MSLTCDFAASPPRGAGLHHAFQRLTRPRRMVLLEALRSSRAKHEAGSMGPFTVASVGEPGEAHPELRALTAR
jgi:hypothetical protein